MKFSGLFAVAAAASLAAAPAIAAPAPAHTSQASQAVQPAGETVDGDNGLFGGGVFVALIAAVVVIVGIVIVAKEDTSPDSP